MKTNTQLGKLNLIETLEGFVAFLYSNGFDGDPSAVEQFIKDYQAERTRPLLDVLNHWDQLIEFNYSANRDAMSAMQKCAFETVNILDGFDANGREI